MKKLKLGKRDIFTPLKEAGETLKAKGKQVNKFISKHSTPPASIQKGQNKKRQTYHMRVDLIPRIKEYAYFEKVDISGVVNEGMDKFLRGYKPKVSK